MSNEVEPTLSLIVAMAENYTIGRDNGLPWRLPNDLAYFKRVTMGHPIIMGRKTFESIGRPLPGRTNIVVSRQEHWSHEGVSVVSSLPAALCMAREKAIQAQLKEVMLIGGATLYEQALPMAARLYLTQVHASVEGDAYFPKLNFDEWREKKREDYHADQSNPFDYSFVVYNRRS